MWKTALPSVKCSRLCLCTRLLIESATVDFFLNLQKVNLVILNKKHQQQRMMPLSWPPTVTNTPSVLTNPLSSHHTQKLQHSPQRTWSTWSSWDVSLTLRAQKSVLMKERDKGVFWFILCVNGWTWVQKWEHSWLRQLQYNHHPWEHSCSVWTL